MEPTRVELVWPGKTDAVERVALPFQIAETINRSRASREGLPMLAQGSAPLPALTDWTNKLIWGDNKPILASLIAGDPSIGLEPLAGKVDLIYIDPPFASGQDFSYRVQVGDETWHKEANLIEEKAYRDTWGQGMESYIPVMHERLVLARELLSPSGSVYLHCDPTASHYLKMLMDNVFGEVSFRNEIAWLRVLGGKSDSSQYGRSSDRILFYTKSDTFIFNPPRLAEYNEKTASTWYSREDKKGRYASRPLTAAGSTGGDSGQPWRGVHPTGHWIVPNLLAERYESETNKQLTGTVRERLEILALAGYIEFSKTGNPAWRRYLDEASLPRVQDLWYDDAVAPIGRTSNERVGYPTQKPEALLERVIKTSSNEDDLVLDFFAGSGTTLAVAEKLGRKWIGCDLSRYAIQATRKRMLDIDECRPFQLLNLGRYERAYWQVNVLNGDKPPERAAAEYYRFIISLYRAEPVGGHRHLHGRKAGRMVHVGPADAPVTRDEIMDAVRECAANRLPGLDVLGWEWELGLHDVIADEAKAEGVDVRLLIIPREVMDKRAVEKGDVRFHELAYLRTSLEVAGLQVVVKLDDFIIPNPELVPDEIRSRIKKWSDYIDFWAVDWNYGAAGEGDVFHNEWQTYRTRSAPALILLSEPHVYAEAGARRILVKVIDIFGNDATKLHEVELR